MEFPHPRTSQIIVYNTDNEPAVQIGTNAKIILYQDHGTRPVIQIQAETTASIIIQDLFLERYISMGGAIPHEFPSLSFGDPGSNLSCFVQATAATGQHDAIQLNFSANTNFIAPDSCVLQISHSRVAQDYIIGSAPFVMTNSGGARETWQNLTLQNGWNNFGLGYPPLRILALGDGTILLEGTIVPGTTVNGTLVATIPANYRPGVIVRVFGGDLGVAGFIDIALNGNMTIFGSAGVVTFSLRTIFALPIIG